MVIAIDGTSSSGKSSLARGLGKRLGITVVGTGSIYRAIALKMLNLSIDEDDVEATVQMLNSTIVQCQFVDGQTSIVVDGIKQDSSVLNSHEVSVFVPIIAQKPYIREFVRKIQRSLAEQNKNIIVEGRDIGSVVFPDASLKLYVDADIETRAKRRLQNYLDQGKNYTLDEVKEELQIRDDQDRQRELSPLIMTSDSIILDTSSLSVEQSVDQVIKILSDKNLYN